MKVHERYFKCNRNPTGKLAFSIPSLEIPTALFYRYFEENVPNRLCSMYFHFRHGTQSENRGFQLPARKFSMVPRNPTVGISEILPKFGSKRCYVDSGTCIFILLTEPNGKFARSLFHRYEPFPKFVSIVAQ